MVCGLSHEGTGGGLLVVGAGVVGVQYDVSPDGKRFLVIEPPTNAPPDLVVVQHWDEELKALVRSK